MAGWIARAASAPHWRWRGFHDGGLSLPGEVRIRAACDALADGGLTMSAPVVVGVDGSPSSLAAVDLAAREALLRGCGLRIVHAFTWPAMHPQLGLPQSALAEGGLHSLADRVVADAVRRAHAAAPEVAAAHAAVVGEPLTVLTGQSRTAALVVVGSRGLGGFTGLLLGSVAVHLAAHAQCPVLVVRGRPSPAGEVLLGVDGSPAGATAVGFAFNEASLRGAELTALHTWNDWTGPVTGAPGDMAPLVYDAGMLRDEEARLLAEAVSGQRSNGRGRSSTGRGLGE
ncbi:universal stress protein [Streptomyces sp. NPDC000880]